MEETAGYSRAVIDGDFAFVAGTTGYDYSTMTMPPDVSAQTRNCFRTIEAALYTAAVVSLLSITTLARQLTAAPAANRPAIQVMADNVLSVRDHSNLAAVFAFLGRHHHHRHEATPRVAG